MRPICQSDGVWRRGLWQVIWSRGQSPRVWWCPQKRGFREISHPFCPGGDIGSVALSAGKQAPAGPGSASALSLVFQAPEWWENKALFQLPSRRSLNMAAPRQQIQPPTQAKMAFLMFTHTTGRHSSDSTLGSLAMPQLRTRATYQRAWAPHTHCLSSSSQQMWKQVWCSSYQQWRNRRQKAAAQSLRPT